MRDSGPSHNERPNIIGPDIEKDKLAEFYAAFERKNPGIDIASLNGMSFEFVPEDSVGTIVGTIEKSWIVERKRADGAYVQLGLGVSSQKAFGRPINSIEWSDSEGWLVRTPMAESDESIPGDLKLT